MCGRFTLTVDPADLAEAFPDFTFPGQLTPRYNIAPTQPVLALPNDGTGKADFFVWGLIPSWAKDPTIGSHLINARAETLSEKPSFRAAYKYRRCLIPSNGFYEWQARPGTKVKVPHFIHLKSGTVFAFAGLWEEWFAPDGSQVKSATIVTTAPNSLMETIHNRMPVIIPPESYMNWLDPAPKPTGSLQSLLVPYPGDKMQAYPVSMLVNSPANDNPNCIIPAS